MPVSSLRRSRGLIEPLFGKCRDASGPPFTRQQIWAQHHGRIAHRLQLTVSDIPVPKFLLVLIKCICFISDVGEGVVQAKISTTCSSFIHKWLIV
jgi:hypothetical protein